MSDSSDDEQDLKEVAKRYKPKTDPDSTPHRQQPSLITSGMELNTFIEDLKEQLISLNQVLGWLRVEHHRDERSWTPYRARQKLVEDAAVATLATMWRMTKRLETSTAATAERQSTRTVKYRLKPVDETSKAAIAEREAQDPSSDGYSTDILGDTLSSDDESYITASQLETRDSSDEEHSSSDDSLSEASSSFSPRVSDAAWSRW